MNSFQRSSFNLLLHLYHKRKEESGYSLVVTLASIIILGTLLVTAALMSKVDSSSTNASTDSNSGFYAAEAGLNLRANDVRNKFIGFNRPNGTEPGTWEDCVDGDNSNNGSDDFICDTSITINDQQIVTFVNDVTENSAVSIEIPDGTFKGLNALEYRYDLMSVALNNEGGQDSPTSILGMRFKSRLIPLFQFAAFYEQDMDFALPPSMTVNGRVHSNNDLYLTSSSSGNFAITGKVTTAGSLYRGDKISSSCVGTVSIFDGSSNRNLDCSGGVRTEYAQNDVSSWNGQIEVGIDKLEVPNPAESFAANPGAEYWDKADLRIVLEVDSNGNPSDSNSNGDIIEIRNADNSTNTTATDNLLMNCPQDGSGNVIESVIVNTGNAPFNIQDTAIKVASLSGFPDPNNSLTSQYFVVADDDYDSNVVINTYTSSGENILTLKRRLGHSSYQSNPLLIPDGTKKLRKAVVSTSDTFYNYREKNGGTGADAASRIRMLNIDMGELINCVDANSLMGGTKALNEDSDGGLVWFFTLDGPKSSNDVTDGDAPTNYGVRLYNSAELDSTASATNIKGLTVVSDQAVYLHGDYNSANKIPAAIIADTINVLSNAWPLDDSWSKGYNANHEPDPGLTINVDSRQATNTTVNAAFLAGIDVSGGASQEIDPDTGLSTQDGGWSTSGGGWNNYPRFHERWTGVTMTYVGSMVTLGAPLKANGPYCGSVSIAQNYNGGIDVCNIYRPPTRNWSYDELFDDAGKLPPLTPRAVFITQEIFERDFTYTSSNPTPLNLTALFSFGPSSQKKLASQPFQTAFTF